MSAPPLEAVDERADARGRLLARIKTGAWLDRQVFPPLAWAVQGIVPEGFGLLVGPPKLGKSWFALGLGLSVAAGGRALGRIDVGPPRPVFYLALEDGDRRLQDRCRKLLIDGPIPDAFEYVTKATPADVLQLIDVWLERHGERQPLVMLDTLGKVMPQAAPGESAYSRDYRVGGHLKALSDAYPGTTLMVVHHTRKAAGDDWMDSTSGTQGLNGSADFTIALSRARLETEAVLKVTGRDVREGEYAMTSAEGSWALAGHSLAEAARAAEQVRAVAGLGDRSAEIVDHVSRHPAGVTAADVGKALELPDARRYLARLVDAGRLVRLERGRYAPTPSVPTVPMSQPSTLEWDNGTHGTGGVCAHCGQALDDWLVDAGKTVHIGCI